MGDTQKSPTQDLRERTRFTRKMGCPTSESVGYFRATEIGVQEILHRVYDAYGYVSFM